MPIHHDGSRKREMARQRGMLRFVVVYGCLLFGLAAAVLLFLIDRIGAYGLAFAQYFGSGWGRVFFECLVQGMLTGAILGVLFWFLFAKRQAKSGG